MIKNNYPGKFIVVEGLDGSGQSTQATKLVDFLNNNQHKAHLTKEPTASLIGGLIRSQLNHDWKSSQDCLQLLFCADRAHHIEKEIIPLLQKGVNVVCDRYFFSTVAYGSLDIKGKNWLLELNKNFLLPDLTILLKVPAKVCLERIHQNRYDIALFEKEELLTMVAENFDNLAEEFENIAVVDGDKPAEEVFEEIKKIVKDKV